MQRAARAATPAVQLVPPIQVILNDIHASIRKELTKIQAEQDLGGNSSASRAKALNDLSAAASRTYDTDRQVQADMAAKLGPMSDEELAAAERALTEGEDGNGER
jgi:hypothetical protein